MVLGPSIAGYGTRLGSSLYSVWVRLDNLGRCVDFSADAGMRSGALAALSDGELRAGFKRAQPLLRLEAKLYYGELR